MCLFKIPYSPCYPHLNQNEWNFFWLTLEANYCRVQVQPRQMQQQQGQRMCASPQDTGGDILHSWLLSCFKKCQKRQNKKKSRIWLKTSHVQNHITSSVLLQNRKTHKDQLWCVWTLLHCIIIRGWLLPKFSFFFTHVSNTGSLTEKKRKQIGSENSSFVGHLMNWHMWRVHVNSHPQMTGKWMVALQMSCNRAQPHSLLSTINSINH